MKQLIVAEKPSQAKDLVDALSKIDQFETKRGYYEGKNIVISHAIGHLFGLANTEEYGLTSKNWNDDLKKLPIIPKKFKLTLDKNKTQQFEVLKTLFLRQDIQEIINSCDNDREGDVIFNYIYKEIESQKKVKRMIFQSQTPKSLLNSYNNLSEPNENRFFSGMIRAWLDWLIGINYTRAMSIKSDSLMHIGRIKSPLLVLITERYIKNKEHNKSYYYIPYIVVEKDIDNIKANYFSSNEKITEKNKALSKIENLGNSIECYFSETKDGIIPNPVLYSLSDLQKEANQRYNYSSDTTLSLAQNLYEKHKLISYPRTDNNLLTTDMKENISIMLERFNDSELNINNNLSVFNDNVESSHHAIILTEKYENETNLNENEKNIYNLITEKIKCSFGGVCTKKTTTYKFGNSENSFNVSYTEILEKGWKKYSNEKDNMENEKEKNSNIIKEFNKKIPNIKKGDILNIQKKDVEEKETKPLPLFTEATLINKMKNVGKDIEDKDLAKVLNESKGLGTEATRSTIIKEMFKELITFDKKNIIPTKKGLFLYNKIKNFDFANPLLTAEIEYRLKKVEYGKENKLNFFNEYKNIVEKTTKQILEQSTTKYTQNVENLGKCPKCKKGNIHEGKKVYYCSNFKLENDDKCTFVVYKEIAKKNISKENAIGLITNKKTKLIKGFVSQKNEKYNAFLILDNECKVKFMFEQKKIK